jgi:3-phosphoshikimate 1-carboxyvinyltransferase
MSLPSAIEIVPLPEPVSATITIPGSKSITNRALVLAALASGPVTLRGALWSEDTQVMTTALRGLGFEILESADPEESANRTITLKGLGGRIPNAGTPEDPLDLFVGNAGTAARFLSALCCLGRGSYRLHGVPRMHERPQAALFQALRALGYSLESDSDRLPVVVHGRGPREGARCTVSIDHSSQFASALMLCAGVGRWTIAVAGDNSEESPYVQMTSELVKVFPSTGGVFQIEPDASSGSYFWGAAWLMLLGDPAVSGGGQGIRRFETDFVARLNDHRQVPSLQLRHWPESNWQFDERFPLILAGVRKTVSRETELGDSIMTAIVLAPLSGQTQRFTDLGRLRMQECERVVALAAELGKCGAEIVEEGDSLTVYPSALHGAEIETYNDHRMAMCFATLGLKVPGIRIQNPACVKKTFPNFFQKLASPPPQGLGASIQDVRTGRTLEIQELFAE